MSFNFKKLLPHLLIIIGFVVAAMAYFNPLLSGKEIFQSDIQQSAGMNSERLGFKKENDKPTYWVNNAFGGMPTYMIGAHYPDNFIRSVDESLRFLPRPADYLFLYFIGFYILLLVMKVDYRLAALGALAFGFSTYLIIILGVGHNSKAQAVAYMPFVLSGILLVFRKRYLWGGLLLTVSLALEIYTKHFQMTYYLMLLVIVLGAVYLYQAFKTKQLPTFFKSIGIMVIAAVLALAANATTLMAASQYTKFSTRGDTGLTITKTGHHKPEEGLTYDYITEYSYGIAETFNLFIPRFMGGASTETLDSDSHAYKSLVQRGVPKNRAKQFLQNTPTYWGKQPIVAAPAYIGATVIFLFVFALYLIKGRLKWWVVGGSLLALVLSWGDNFGLLTKFFIDYVPYYSKFRSVSSIQVILELLLPMFGIYGLFKLFSAEKNKSEKLHALKWASIITAGVCVFFLLFKTWLFDFSGMHDSGYRQNIGAGFVNALKEDRIAMLNTDTIRSLVFVLLSAVAIFGYLKGFLNKKLCVVLFALLILVDLISVDRNYVNDDDFVQKSVMANPFRANAADKEIMKDNGHFRVLDLSTSPLNSARASYFHNSLGGYHAAKPGRLQELFDFHISEGNQQVINMLNTKYMIIENQGKTMAQPNPEANGNAWFVNDVQFVDSANDEILALDSINTKKTAVVNRKFQDIVDQDHFQDNPGDTIALESYQANKLVYNYSTQEKRLAVFSEMYYPHGWKIKIDGEKVDMAQADYVLRALMLPKGDHKITFEFDPDIVKTGSSITLATGILLAFLVIGGLVYTYKNRRGEDGISETEA